MHETITEASSRTGISADRLTRAARQGRIPGAVLDAHRRWRLPRRAVDQFAADETRRQLEAFTRQLGGPPDSFTKSPEVVP